MKWAAITTLILAAVSAAGRPPEKALFEARLLFPPDRLHNHASCVVETPGGGLFACWYRGSGERGADDVAVLGARFPGGAARWTAPFALADTPGFPDTNPCLFVDPRRRLWMFYVTILDNRWESALLKVRVSSDYENPRRPPKWEAESVLHVKPGPEFLQTFERDHARLWEPYRANATPAESARLTEYLASRRKMAEEKLSVRLGWMTRVRPAVIPRGGGHRLVVPLYSDGFDFSLFALSDDWGATWRASAPVVGPGSVQPSLARRKDGTLAAFFRDNGPPPQRVMQSESRDDGETWSEPRDTPLPDPGAGVEVTVLKSGRWVLAHNDAETGRHSLALSVSEDEGRTWAFRKAVERDLPGPDAGSYSYPSLFQARDGLIHLTYTYRPNKTNAAKEGPGETIKHARFSEAWLTQPADREPL